MKVYFITFRSVTHAQRGERLLSERGIRCILRRTPRWMEAQGCGYCLQMTLAEILPPVELLRSRGIPMRKVYVRQGSGDFQEVRL